ncbi:MAG: KUP/HAK/KT family potassium transporter [Bacteroidota bacterium]
MQTTKVKEDLCTLCTGEKYKAGWVIFPAIIGCAAIIADGFITPSFSISAARGGIDHRLP